MTPRRPEQPATAAGRALLAQAIMAADDPDDEELTRMIRAIEREAAAAPLSVADGQCPERCLGVLGHGGVHQTSDGRPVLFAGDVAELAAALHAANTGGFCGALQEPRYSHCGWRTSHLEDAAAILAEIERGRG